MTTYLPPPAPPPGLWARWSVLRLVLFGFMLLAANFLVLVVVFGLTRHLFLPILCGNLLGVLLPASQAARVHGSNLATEFHLRRTGLVGALVAIVGAAVALVPSSFLAELSARIHPVDAAWVEFYQARLPDSALGIAVAVLAVVGIGPLAEEILFRGLLHRVARRSWGPWPAALVSSIAFGLVHGEPWFFFGLVGLGLWLAFLYEATGNLMVPVLAHAVHNGVSLTLMMVQRDSLGAAHETSGTDLMLLAASLAAAGVLAWVLRRMRTAARARGGGPGTGGTGSDGRS